MSKTSLFHQAGAQSLVKGDFKMIADICYLIKMDYGATV